MKLCIAGKNSIAIEFCRWLFDTGMFKKSDIVVCFNKTDDGLDTFMPSFKKYCKEQQLLEKNLHELYDIKELIFLSLEFDTIVDTEKFITKRLYNMHFSLLPAYKGMYTSALPILHGEKSSGVSLHVIDKGVDTGDIIAQKEFLIDDEDSARDLYFKYTEYALNLLKDNFKDILDETFSTKKQPVENSSYYSKISIDYSNIKIDLNKTAYEIKNQIRAFSFREYQLPKVHGYLINSSKILESKTALKAGSIIQDRKKYIDITTIDYDIRLIKEI